MPDTKLYQINFAQGLDQRTASKYVQQGRLLQAVNVVFNKTGSIEKRPGNASMPTTVRIPGGDPSGATVLLGPGSVAGQTPLPVMAKYGSELVQMAGAQLYSLYPNAGGFVEKDYVSEATATRRPLAQTAQFTVFKNPVIAWTNGYTTYAWDDGTGFIYLVTYDSQRRSQVVNGTLVSVFQGTVPQLVVVGSKVVALWQETGGPANTIQGAVLDTTVIPLAWGAAQTVVSNALPDSGKPAYDTFAISGTAWLLAFPASGGGGGVVIAPCSLSGSTIMVGTTSLVDAGRTGIKSVAVYGNAADAFGVICYGTSTQTLCYGFNANTLAQSFGVTFLWTNVGSHYAYVFGLARLSSSSVFIAWNDEQSVPMQCPLYMNTVTSAGVLGATAAAPLSVGGLELRSKPWVYAINGPSSVKVYCHVSNPSAIQGTQWIVELQPALGLLADVGRVVPVPPSSFPVRAISTIAPRFSNITGKQRSQSTLPMAVSPNPGQFLLPSGTLAGSGLVGAINTAELLVDFTKAARFTAELGRSLYIGGGLGAQTYDGQFVDHAAFQLFPEGISAASPGAGSTNTIGSMGVTNNATYQYVFIYEKVNARGEIRRSAASKPASVATGGNNQVTVSNIPFLPLVSRSEGTNLPGYAVSIIPFRTAGVSGSIFYRMVGAQPPSFLANVAGGSGAPTTLSFVDKLDDVSLQTNPFLYDTGGVLDNVCPPSLVHMVAHKNRLRGIGDDLRSIWATKEVTEGEVPGWNEALIQTIDQGGDLVALVSLDDKIVAFEANAIHVQYGDGPNDTGAGSDWSPFYKMASPFGCIEPRSLCLTEDGIVFQSARGIELLTRDLQVVWLGAPVVDTLASFPVVTAATYYQERSEVRIDCMNAVGTVGVELCYNTLLKQWTQLNKYDSVAGVALSAPIASSVEIGGVFYWTTVVGNVFQEDTLGINYMDGGSAAANWVTVTIETGWMDFGTVSTLQRQRQMEIIGKWYSSHDLIVSIATDFVESYNAPTGQSNTWPSQVTDNVDPYEFNQQIVNQIAHGMKVKVQDAFPSGGVPGSGRGFALDGMLAEITATMAGAGRRLPATQKG